ncbi:MAG TPA: tetratricopeptide repeat protein [Coriobacteriia bacterium]
MSDDIPEPLLEDVPDAADAVDGDAPDADEVARDSAADAVRTRRSAVDRWLIAVTVLVVAVFLGTAVAVIALVLSVRDAPRTAVERQITTDEVAVKEVPQDVENWARLALTYGRAKRWSDAAYAIAQARKIKQAPILDLVEADVLRMEGDRGAIAAYDRAVASAQAEYDAAAKVLLEKKGVKAPPPSAMVFQAMAGRALALDAAGRTEEAVEQARSALELDPTDAVLRASLGDMLLKLGRPDDAETQYRQALEYVPDLKAALDGLRKLGKVR